MSQLYHTPEGPKKYCPRCDTTFDHPSKHFSVDKKRPDGLQAYCKSCSYASTQASEKNNPQLRINRTEWKRRKRREAGIPEKSRVPTPPEKHRGYSRKWRETHHEKVAELNEVNRKRQWDARRALGKVEKPILPVELRKGRLIYTKAMWQRNNPRPYNPVNLERVREQSGDICSICNKPFLPEQQLHVDHIIPWSLGGEHSESNLRYTHAVCNVRKHDMLIENMTPHQRRGPD